MSSAQRHALAPRPAAQARAATRAHAVPARGATMSQATGRSGAVRWSVATPAARATGIVQDGAARSATRTTDGPAERRHERSVTVMFTDIEDSTALVERLGDDRWLELFSRHSALVHHHVARRGGVVVKGQGDGFMAAFADPAAAVACAVAVQRDVAAGRAGEEPFRVRIGLHTGAAIRHAGDFHGRTVVIAARISAHARGGETLVSDTVAHAVGPAGAVRFAARGDVALKGLEGRHAIFAA
jgi:class 3 adenylate cyclase